MKQNKEVDWVKLGKIFQSQKADPDKVKKEYEKIENKNKFKGDLNDDLH